jgi:hypothetical protein
MVGPRIGPRGQPALAFVAYRHPVLRLMRLRYRCGSCHQDYDLPGVDLSFFYGWFLGVSPSLDAVVFDTVSYPGFEQVRALIDSVAGELPHEDPGLWTAKVLTEVCDPDRHGNRYVFAGTPGCPACTSTKVETFTGTEQPWLHRAREATYAEWDGLSHQAKLARLRVTLGLHRHDAENRFDLDDTEQRYGQAIADCAWALLAGEPLERCGSTTLARIEAVRAETLQKIDDYAGHPLLPANTRWKLVTKLDRLHRRTLDNLDALVQPH